MVRKCLKGYWQSGGHEFDPRKLHHKKQQYVTKIAPPDFRGCFFVGYLHSLRIMVRVSANGLYLSILLGSSGLQVFSEINELSIPMKMHRLIRKCTIRLHKRPRQTVSFAKRSTAYRVTNNSNIQYFHFFFIYYIDEGILFLYTCYN